MGQIVNLASQPYAVGLQSFPVTVPAGVTSLDIVVTRVGWPSGHVAAASVVWSDGSGCGATFDGGTQLDFRGNPRTTAEITISKQPGVTQGTVTVNVLQALTAAITVNSS